MLVVACNRHTICACPPEFVHHNIKKEPYYLSFISILFNICVDALQCTASMIQPILFLFHRVTKFLQQRAPNDKRNDLTRPKSDLLWHGFISHHGFSVDQELYAIRLFYEEIGGHLASDFICPSQSTVFSHFPLSQPNKHTHTHLSITFFPFFFLIYPSKHSLGPYPY